MKWIETLIRQWCIQVAILGFVAGCAGDSPVSPPEGATNPAGAGNDVEEADEEEDDDDDDDDSEERDEDDLDFLEPGDHSPPLATTRVSFYAVRGQERQTFIMYRAEPGAADSSEFVRFVVPAGALVKRPGGSPIAMGDSLQITLTVVDTLRLIVDFQPYGLRFALNDPARLRFSYGETDDDLDDDDDVDEVDEDIETTFAVWRQETTGEPFSRVSSTRDEVREQVTADIGGFTRYAVAY